MSEVINYIIRYPGRCVTFNLDEVWRVTKKQENDDDPEVKYECPYGGVEQEGGGKKAMKASEVWNNNDGDDGNFIIVRLIGEQSSHPWVVAHQGMHEIFRASLFVPIFEVNKTDFVLTLFVRDHANRGTTRSIRRKFYLKFNSMSELEVFQLYHNSILEEWNKKKNGCDDGQENKNSKEEVDAAAGRAVQSFKEKDAEIISEDDKQKKEEDDENTRCNGKEEEPHPRKKRKLEEIDADTEDKENKVIEEKEAKERKHEEEEQYKMKYQQLEHGDGLLDLVDDHFESTQNPFGVDESF